MDVHVCLQRAGSVTKTNLKWHKIVGNGELTVKNLIVQAHAFTGSAKEAIEGAGGKCQLLSPTTNEVVDMAAMA
jgi:large subunit ribosomal protein L15